MKNLGIVGVTLTMLISIVSCDLDTDHNEPVRQAIGDVFVRCVLEDNDTLYAPVFYTYSNFEMKSVQVEGPVDSNIELNLSEYNSKIRFRWVPSANDFSTNDIANGIYEFKIVAFDGETYTISDRLLESRIDPVVINEFTYDDNLHEFTLDWHDIEDAHVYVVRIHDAIDGEIIYSSERMLKSNHQFSQSSEKWYDFATTKGAEYVLGVYAYQFESSNAISGNDNNCESVAYRTFQW